MTVEFIAHNNTIVISEIIDGHLVTRRYIGYTKSAAIRKFIREEVNREQR